MLAGTADYAQCHAAGADDPPFNKRTWARANPSLAYMPDLMATITREAGHARTDPSLFPSFTALRLNGGTSDTEESVLLEAGTWAGIEGETDRAGRCVWGCGFRHVCRHVCRRRLLAGHRASGVRGRVSRLSRRLPSVVCVMASEVCMSQTHTRGELIQTGDAGRGPGRTATRGA